MKILAVIPTRSSSTRFPGKFLAKIRGKEMVLRVYDQIKKTTEVTDVIIASEDEEMEAFCKQHGIQHIMTSNTHQTGTDRVAEVATLVDADIYVNVQGDEPIIPPEAIDITVQRLKELLPSGVLAVNAFDKSCTKEDAQDPSIVKMVTTVDEKNVLFLSRYGIPFEKGAAPEWKTQLGLYAFTKNGLEVFSKRKLGPIEESENVEMLRYIEYGDALGAVEVPGGAVSVDYGWQIEKVEKILDERGLD